MIVLSLGHTSKSNKERDTIYMATRRMAGLDEKQTEWGVEVEVEVEGRVGGTEYWQCRLGLQWKRVSMLRRRRLTGARVARHLVPPTSEKQTKRERAKKKQEAHKIKPPFKREEEQWKMNRGSVSEISFKYTQAQKWSKCVLFKSSKATFYNNALMSKPK